MVKAIEFGNALARAIGHKQGCPKVSPMIPCVCGCAGQQAKALDDWQHFVADYEAPIADIQADQTSSFPTQKLDI
jgi:uncharacterized protein YcfL